MLEHVQGYNDNSGLGPIIAQHLQDDLQHAKILVLIMNELGDHQMKEYFTSSNRNDGMMCEAEGSKEEAFSNIKKTHEKAFTDVGGTYVERDGEKTCAVRLASAKFFEVGRVSLVSVPTSETHCSTNFHCSTNISVLVLSVLASFEGMLNYLHVGISARAAAVQGRQNSCTCHIRVQKRCQYCQE